MDTRITYVTMSEWKRKFLRRTLLRIINLRKETMLIGKTILMEQVGYEGFFTNCRS
jgi:hypothetical protein